MLPKEVHTIIASAKKYLSRKDIEKQIIKAFLFAKKAHEGQFRHSGNPYINHPVATTSHLMSLRPDLESIQACLLHDVPEDTTITIEEIKKEFGEEVAMLTDGMEKLGKIKYRGEERAVENLRKMFLAMSKDLRVVFIKLCDRLHNMETIHFLPKKEKIIRIANETLNIYAPIATRLGIYTIKDKLEDTAFQILHSKEYDYIVKQLEEKSKERDLLIEMAKKQLQSILKKNSIHAEVLGRVKTPYSIFKKLQQKGKTDINDLYDIFALRVIVKDKTTCYTTLGIIHEHFTPLSHRFKDYIAVPKINNYQSLHTTIVGLGKSIKDQAIEIQIRTHIMDEEAEFGIASHCMYKEKGSIYLKDSEIGWVKQLADISKGNKNHMDLMESIKLDLFQDRIFVLTPKGGVVDLPVGSTPIDFAYRIHTDIGHRCKGAKVEGNIVPLNYELKSGDMVEILTQKELKPNRYWLGFVKSSEARSKIKAWFRSQNREEVITLGKEILNKQLHRFSYEPLDPELNILSKLDGKNISFKQREGILESIGNGSVTAVSIIKKIIPLSHIRKKEKEEKSDISMIKNKNVVISGEKNISSKFVACCHPEPPDTLVGYVTRGGAVSIHKTDCCMLQHLDPKRFVPVSWEKEKKEKYLLLSRISLVITDQVGVLKEILEIIYRFNLNIVNLSTTNRDIKNGQIEIVIDLEIEEYEILDRLISTLSVMDSVLDVEGEVLQKDTL